MDEARDGFVGRIETLDRLKNWLAGKTTANGRLGIGSIAGSAGIGKTYLLDHALRETNVIHRKYVTLRLSGDRQLSTLARAFLLLLQGAQTSSGKSIRFPQADECWRALEWMDARARAEVEAAVKDDAELAKTIADVFSVLVGLAELVPHPLTRTAARIAGLVPKKHVEHVVRLIQTAVAFQSEKLPRFRGRHDVRLRNNLRKDLAATLVAAVVSDLKAGLVKGMLGDRSMQDRDRLLLIIDDYEQTENVLGDALLRCIVPALKNADFETLMIVIGRDRLTDTDTGWSQHHQETLLPPIMLEELTRDEAEQYARLRGVERPETIERIIRDTAGYPYLLAAEVADELNGESSALSRKNFFDRTTQWMTTEQKEWSKRLAFLDEVSLDTIPRVIDVSQPETLAIMEWFKAEASLRSPRSRGWSLLPMIRTKLREYVKNDSETLYDELMRAGSAGSSSTATAPNQRND
jgi:hypothetical protein